MNGLPDEWALTPCLYNKSPWRSCWNTEDPLRQERVFEWLYEEHRTTCIGVRTGSVSSTLIDGTRYGLLAVDFDGVTSFDKYKELSGGESPVPTVTITSGVPAHCQMFYHVAEQYWPFMKAGRKAWQTQKKPLPLEHLEIRWDNHQSIVYGQHPSGSFYKFIYGPLDYEIAKAPEFLINLLFSI